MEVFDLESDVVVYDVKNKEILSKASLITKDAFETFPAFSPDGKWLYFCTAPAQKMPENYDKVRYISVVSRSIRIVAEDQLPDRYVGTCG